MSGERDLTRLLAALDPELHPGEYAFASVPGELPPGVEPVATIREAEGLSVVVERSAADAAGLEHDFVAAWITLTVHSALDAVGLTAEVARRLAHAGIACNIVAGVRHDHLFVPADRAQDALAALRPGATSA